MKLKFAPLLVLLLILTACSSKKAEEPVEVKEPNADSSAGVSVDTPESSLVRSGKRLYYAGLYSVAKEHFASLKNGYPTSPYVEFAEIKIADCLYEMREYPEAAAAYDEFIKSRPSSKATPYMMFRAARSFQLSNRGAGRDSAPLEKSLEYYNKLLEQYPDSVYASASKKFRSEAVDHIAQHEQRILAFYQKKNMEKAVAARAKTLETKWQPLIAETAFREDAAAPAPRGIKAEEAIVQAPVPAGSGKIATTTTAFQSDASTASNRILRAVCSTSGVHGVFLYLDKPITDPAFMKRVTELSPTSGGIALTVPDSIAKEQKIDCFGTEDLKLDAAGNVSLKGVQSASVMTLENPPRLFISVK